MGFEVGPDGKFRKKVIANPDNVRTELGHASEGRPLPVAISKRGIVSHETHLLR